MSTTDLARLDEARAPALAGDLVVWAHEARQAHEIAIQLAETSFVSKAMFRRPGEVTGAILAGRELGLMPMSSLAAIDIIEGKPALSALALRGLVEAHGHEIWVDESSDTRAVVCGQRKGSSRVQRSVWTLDRARKAGLAGKKNWREQTASMLVARSTSEVCRWVAADVLIGMPYSVEELADGAAEQMAGVGPAEDPKPAKARRVVQRAPVAPPAPPPPADVDFDAPAEPEPAPTDSDDTVTETATAISNLEQGGFDVEIIDPGSGDGDAEPVEPTLTDPQLRRLGVGFRQAGITDRAQRLEFAAGVVGRPLTSSKELTVSEATAVIKALISAAEKQDDVKPDAAWPPVPPQREEP